MKPLNFNDEMVIPENALNSKVVLMPDELQKVQGKLKREQDKIDKERGGFVHQSTGEKEEEGKDGEKPKKKKKEKKQPETMIIDQQSRCLSCWVKKDADQMYEISYRMIIEDHNNQVNRMRNKQNAVTVT